MAKLIKISRMRLLVLPSYISLVEKRSRGVPTRSPHQPAYLKMLGRKISYTGIDPFQNPERIS